MNEEQEKKEYERARGMIRDMMDEGDKKTAEMLSNSLREVFGENLEKGRFIDVSRVPMICKNIQGIDEKLGEMRDIIKLYEEKHVTHIEFWPVKTIVYSGVGIVLTAVVVAVVALVVNQ